MENKNIIKDKSFLFSLKIIRVCKDLKISHEFELSKQLLKSGTSIGANVEEATGAFSKPDFIYRMAIAYREARETTYWIRLLMKSGDISYDCGTNLLHDSRELERLLVSILKTSKSNP